MLDFLRGGGLKYLVSLNVVVFLLFFYLIFSASFTNVDWTLGPLARVLCMSVFKRVRA